MNTFLSALSGACRRDLLREKWLLAPSLRVGYQWLDQIALSGQPLLNLHVQTLLQMALRLAGPPSTGRSLRLLTRRHGEILCAALFARLRPAKLKYLACLESGRGVAQAITRTIQDLRLAGLTARHLKQETFEIAPKGHDIALLLAAYEQELESQGLIDYAGLVKLAAEQLRENPLLLPTDLAVLIPEVDFKSLKRFEKDLLQALPEGALQELPVDPPADVPCATARIFAATGEPNEVREILRRCTGEQIPLDQVEVLYTNTDTYLPLIYEEATRLMDEDGDTLPVTFAEGVPARYFRPGRALAAWVEWNRDDFPQATLARMIQDGLLIIPGDEAGFAHVATVLRSVPIGSGREQYGKALKAQRDALKLCLKDGPETNENDSDTKRRELIRRQGALEILNDLTRQLLISSPGPEGDRDDILALAIGFLVTQSRSVTAMDNYAGERLRDEIRDLQGCLDEIPGDAGLDAYDWLAGLSDEVRVGGQGPRPGHLFVSNVRAGGHSGRAHTYVIGLDDERFPGAGLQDPLVLDAERRRVASELPTAADELSDRLTAFRYLLARLRGSVTQSYSRHDLVDDRERAPSSVLSSEPGGDRVSFAPGSESCCIDMADWWLWRSLDSRVERESLQRQFPHLSRGWIAQAARAGDRFTEFDGYVPEAGRDLDPLQSDGPVLSASRLELMARMPLEYLFKYVLEVVPPEEHGMDSSVWLDALRRGALLHDVFHRFLAELTGPPSLEQGWARLQEILADRIQSAARRYPPPSEAVFARERAELQLTTRVFLAHEEELCEDSTPYRLEVSVGMRSQGQGTDLDWPEPVSFALPEGRTIRLRGRIDRLDRIPETDEFTVWDYKTGRSKNHAERPPFNQGRSLQGPVYLALANARLPEVAAGARAVRFGYFFPGRGEHGRRLFWSAGELAAGAEVIARLCEMLAAGSFPASDQANDMKYSDYADALGDRARLASSVRRKLADKILAPFLELRHNG